MGKDRKPYDYVFFLKKLKGVYPFCTFCVLLESRALIDHISLVIFSLKFLLSSSPGNIFMFDHMFELSFHCNNKEHDKIHDQNWPEDWHIEKFKESTCKCHNCGTCCPPPKLEFGQSSNKRLKFRLVIRWQAASIFVIFIVVCHWLNFGCKKGNK